MALCHSQVTLMLSTDITLQKPHIPASFNMYLIINKWVIAVKVSNFSGQYLRNHRTLNIGVLGYIVIVWPKEHSPEVRSFPPGTLCIYIYIYIYITFCRPYRWLSFCFYCYIHITQRYITSPKNVIEVIRRLWERTENRTAVFSRSTCRIFRTSL